MFGLPCCHSFLPSSALIIILRIVMLMYFEEPRDALIGTRISVQPGLLLAISVNGVAALLLGVLPSGLIEMCRISMVS